MTVVTMTRMEAASWFLYLLIAILVISSRWFSSFMYIFPIILFVQYTILIWMIPLNLNWSRGLYSHLFWKSILFFGVTAFSFSFVYWFKGIVDTATESTTYDFLTSIYFSITTWSTLGYGDFRPVPELRLLTSLEAILGILSMPLIFTMIWKYCDFRIRDKSSVDEQEETRKLKLQLDERGMWKQLDDNKKPVELTQEYDLIRCKKCGNKELKVERYFDIFGLLSPRMQFIVHCTCGNHIYKKHLAMSAAKAWNKKNKEKNG